MITRETPINNDYTNKPCYDPTTSESRCTINGRSFHVYKGRLENVYTYIGYDGEKKNEIRQLEASALTTQKQSTKIYNPQNNSVQQISGKPDQDVLSQLSNELNHSDISQVSDESMVLDKVSLPDEWLLPAYTIAGFNKGNIDSLCKVINEINLTAELKINIKKTSDGNVQLYHTENEIKIFAMLYPELLDFFFMYAKSCFHGNFSSKGLICERTQDVLEKLETQYSELPHQKLPEIVQPENENFSGKKEEIEKVFASLLSQSKGLIVGEEHGHLSPKEILIEQMQCLYDQGVRTLFLEFCSYDTLQEALDNFYVTKKPSEFIKKFLENGYGGSVKKGGLILEYVNYYTLVHAAVLAGIRPVGLELSSTQILGWKSFEGSQGKDRHIGMNVPAKQIIEREQGEGKYIAFVGAAHASYAENIAGLSELCGVPAMVISDKEEETDPQKYEKNQEHLGFDVKLPENSKLFNNTQGKVHFIHAHLTCAPKGA